MTHRRILVATDFSTRSDRALRRGVLLARATGARLDLVHVVDDDQPSRIVDAERIVSASILDELASTLHSEDGLDCAAHVVEGDAFQGLAQAAETLEADLVVIGPHRRQALKGVFVGTTAERTIRTCPAPVVMANSVPAAPYRHVLIAVDFSDRSAAALRAVKVLGLETGAAVSALHVFEAPGAGHGARGSVRVDSMKAYLAEEEERASRELGSFLARNGHDPAARHVRRNTSSTASTICDAAQEANADLLVVGTLGRSGVAKILLGSVAQEVLRIATVDVMAVPAGKG